MRVLAGLAETKLEGIIVGNVAAILHGAPVTTQDLDLIVRDTPRNRTKIEALGAYLGARPQPISPLTATLRIDAAPGTVDLLFDQIAGGLRFQSLRSRARKIEVGPHHALVARLEDVIASKEAAGRPKDRAVLPILRDTLRIKQALDRRSKPGS